LLDLTRTSLLTVCASWLGRPGAAERARAALDRAAGDAPAFAHAARGHRLAPLVLEEAGKLGAAPALLDALRTEVRAGAALQLVLEAAAGELAGAARERGLSAVHLKGPAVDRRYGGRGLRTFDDLDLLVPAGELDGWHECLRALGYEPAPPFGYSWKRAPQETVELHSKSLELYGLLDLPAPMQPVRLAPEAMRARAAPLEGLPFPALAVEDELILAACHGFGLHLFERLVWLLDVAVLARQVREPARPVEIARSSGADRLLFHAMEIARKLGLLAGPAEAWLAALRPARIGRTERHLVERLVRGRRMPERAEFLLAMAMPAPAGFRRALVARAVFPTRKRMQRAAFGGRGPLWSVLTHLRQLARIGALIVWG
jgi:hypothetical protein